MEFDLINLYIDPEDGWKALSTYYVRSSAAGGYDLYYASDFAEHNCVKTLSLEEAARLQLYPFTLAAREKYGDEIRLMLRIGDLACALLSERAMLTPDALLELILQRKNRYQIDSDRLIWMLRCLLARRVIAVKEHKGCILLLVGPLFEKRERARKFASSIAGELELLSERIGHIVSHGPSVGTYRENLLISALRKHLPERYHVATGFIYNLNRQLDIIVYDRIDYAPIFREENLVVVPQESVRAVIEVKTNLKRQNLQEALVLLNECSYVDDNAPPFFKGIFAFDTSMSSESFLEVVSDFYTDVNTMSQDGAGALICTPFRHCTCVCVNGKAFAHINYERDADGMLVPCLYSKESETDLTSQTGFFIQSLLSYLQYGGMKKAKTKHSERMLGEDAYSRKVKALRGRGDVWGAYFAVEEGDAESDAVAKMENLITSVERWVRGEESFEVLGADPGNY